MLDAGAERDACPARARADACARGVACATAGASATLPTASSASTNRIDRVMSGLPPPLLPRPAGSLPIRPVAKRRDVRANNSLSRAMRTAPGSQSPRDESESSARPLTGGPVACHAMTDRFSDRSPDYPSEDDLRAHAAFEARRSASGIGAAVARAGARDGEHFWECIVSDGEEWHFIRVLGVDFRPVSRPRYGRHRAGHRGIRGDVDGAVSPRRVAERQPVACRPARNGERLTLSHAFSDECALASDPSR